MTPGRGADHRATAWYVIPSNNYLVRWFNLLHWPFTIWHLSYVVIGAGLHPEVDAPLLVWTVLAFFLGMGVAAHCADLLHGDPLALSLPRWQLASVGGTALVGAVAIGSWQVLAGNVAWAAFPAVAVGAVLAVGYGLEWPGLHGDYQFALWWGVFPFLVGYLAQGVVWDPALLYMGGFLFLTALAQRELSTRVRFLRRKVDLASCSLTNWDPETQRNRVTVQDKSWLLAPDDRTLMLFSVAMPLLAAAVTAW